MKAVLVIDMPDDCLLCPLCDYAVDWKGETTFYCRANEKDIDDTCEVAQWCPLRPLPERKDEGSVLKPLPFEVYMYRYGFNECLDEIVGETE